MLFKYNVNHKREKKTSEATEVKVSPPELPPRDYEEESDGIYEEEGDEIVRGPKRPARHARSGSRNNGRTGYQGNRRT
jgi:hypothetical protein